jgi:putative tryptophan/tyrosine transport system substrate-binding protein
VQRRGFLLIAGTAALGRAIPAPAQQQTIRTIGAVMSVAEKDPDTQARLAAFRQGLAAHGWAEGKNLRIEWRWSEGDVTRVGRYLAEIIALKPDLIVANGTPVVAALKRSATTIPAVAILVMDPVGLGVAQNLARPGGHITGFSFINPGILGKWRELLGEAAPGKKRAALLFNPEINPEYYDFLHDVPAAPPGTPELVAAPAKTIDEARAALMAMGKRGDAGLVIGPDALMIVHVKELAQLAREERLPGVSVYRQFAVEGGLMSYGPDVPDIFRRSADYVDRILKGANPGELPIQEPNKFEFTLNSKTAAALGITLPQTLLATADEVIE